MSAFSFIKEYITKPTTVGAVLPSSRFLARKMVAGIDFEQAECIVEYGAGTGVFSREILKRRKPETVVIFLEKNEHFHELLCQKFMHESNVYIINDSAEKIGEYLAIAGKSAADYIVSGLPFASLPTEVSTNILAATVQFLKPGGAFITFQYSRFKKAMFLKYFSGLGIKREFRNVPPAYVFTLTNG